MTTGIAPATGIDASIAGWHPGDVTRHDVITVDRVNHLAATLNETQRYDIGDGLPMMWHSIFFQEWPATSELGTDGHPAHGHFLPPIADRRRMFAGAQVTVDSPIILGESASATTSLHDVDIKRGRTGELLFVTIRNEYHQRGQRSIVEHQNLVYRSGAPSTPNGRERRSPQPMTITSTRSFTPDTTLLFRFRALTSNAHRIHYDQQYATMIEGFPGLVVHGPLLAIYMATHAANGNADTLRTFAFRLQHPAIAGKELHVQTGPHLDGNSIEVRVVDNAGVVHASARAF